MQSQGGEDLSTKTRRLREEIKKIIESEDAIYGKIRGLVESFREIIPEESQRYHAAVKALSATSKLTRQEIVKGVDNQLEELKILEKGLLSALPGWREELKAMETKARGLRDDIARLRETIGRLESEEKGILSGMAVRQKEMELVEKSVGEVFADIGAVITSVRKKLEESSVESAPAPALKTSQKSGHPGGRTAAGVQTSEVLEPTPPQQDMEWQKKCPMCGGRMDFHLKENKWMCYTCAYEEAKKETAAEPVLSTGGEKSASLESSSQQDTAQQKKCPMCGGRMDFHANEQVWMCYSCAHEEKGVYANTPDHPPAPASIFPEPSTDLSSDEGNEPIRGSIQEPSPSKKPQSAKKKTCPSCRKKMNWHEEDRAWRCPYCEYERRI